MSGGFFRGTSADQDTRFSNKQAKLLKSQKFASELENLVDMTKVKLDVMRPWIAKRVTELIGFEDEVLINFIYELLEGKRVDGKQVQISLTGFMERNTGKFMKELWTLLLSAEQNASGVPQQFLDAKEEETKRKMVETDRIANEIQRKKEKEKQEIEQEKSKMGGDGARPRDQHAELELNEKDDVRGSSVKPAEDNERHKKNGQRRHDRDSQSPDSSYHSPSLRERRRSRSISGAPPSRSRSISSEKRHSSPKRSVSPQRRYISQHSLSPRRRSPHSKRQSPSHSRRRFPSPDRYRVSSARRHRSRSPLRRRSRSPVRRRSRSPLRRRSRTPIKRSSLRHRSRTPLRQRSPSPVKRRSPSPKPGTSLSPVRGRSPSPVRRRRSPSPVRRRRSPSPVRHRRSPSPVRRRRFPSPVRRFRSPSPVRRRRSPSPVRRRRSPARRRYQRSPSIPGQQSVSPVHRKRSSTPVTLRSPQELNSPSDTRRSSLSPVPVHSRGEKARHGKYSPARRISPKERIEIPAEKETRLKERRPVVSLRSPQREILSGDDLNGKERGLSPPLANSSRGKSYSEERSPHTREKMAHPENSNPLWKAVGDKPYRESSVTSADDGDNLSNREIGEYNNKPMGKNSPTSRALKDSFNTSEVHGLIHSTKSQKTQLPRSDLITDKMYHKEHREQELSTTSKVSGLTLKGMNSYDNGDRAKDKKTARAYETKGGYRLPEMESIPELSSKSEQNGSLDSRTKETVEYRVKRKEKRKHKKSHRQEVGSDGYSSYDSHEERKEAKKRKKEEKEIKKEERRRRRDDRRHKTDGTHAEKYSEDESVRRESGSRQTQENESEQKRLEIELREKALESLRAKKGLGN